MSAGLESSSIIKHHLVHLTVGEGIFAVHLDTLLVSLVVGFMFLCVFIQRKTYWLCLLSIQFLLHQQQLEIAYVEMVRLRSVLPEEALDNTGGTLCPRAELLLPDKPLHPIQLLHYLQQQIIM